MIHRFGQFIIDCRQRELSRDGDVVPLEPQVFDLLALLVARQGAIVSRSELVDTVWGGRFVSDATIDSRIAAARRAIGDSGAAQAMIRTLPRRGFRFVAEVESVAAPETVAAPALPDLPSIAVLPFENRSPDRNLAIAADVLVEDVTTLLARQHGFFVVSTRSTYLYRDRAVDVRTIGRELGVRYLVTGSLRPAGAQIHVSVSLVDATTGRQLWSGQFDSAPPSLPELQIALARIVISTIEPALENAELTLIGRRRERDLDAWALYRTAMARISLDGWNPSSFADSRADLERALLRDPGFALCHGYLAMTLALAEIFGILGRSETLHAEIRHHADTAIQLDPNDSQVVSWSACAYADIGDMEPALELAERALVLDPSNAHAWLLRGMLWTIGGRVEAGLADVRHGIRLSPQDRRLGKWGALLAGCYLRAGLPEEALREARLAFLRDANIWMAKLIEALAASRLGRRAEARTALRIAANAQCRLGRPELEHFLSPADAEQMLQLWADEHPLRGTRLIAAADAMVVPLAPAAGVSALRRTTARRAR